MKSSFFNLYLISCLFLLSLESMNPSKVEVAINCGGEELRSHSGIRYLRDTFYEGGQTSDFGSNFEIKLAKDQEVYQTERWSSEDFYYSIPVKSEGKYVVIFKFSEVYFNAPGEKIFDVEIGGETVLQNVDIFGKVGKATALDEYVQIEIKNGKCYINGKATETGFDANKKTLKIKFVKKEKDNPKINAIVLVKGTIEDTDYNDFIGELEKMEKSKIEREKKQREFQRVSKSIDFEDFEDDFVDDGVTYSSSSGMFSAQSIIVYVVLGAIGYYVFIGKKRRN